MRKTLYLYGMVLFVGFFLLGVWLSYNKPLWNDEIFTQTANIEVYSYARFIKGDIGVEGNKCPLFYVFQKGVTDLLKYKFPCKWHHEWLMEDARSQIILRIVPNIFMSLALVFIFLFFAGEFSGKAGIFSLLVSLSTSSVWIFWAEARPYSLWFFLTVLQTRYLLQAIRHKDDRWVFVKLAVIHVLMSLTIALSLVQIVVVSTILFLFCSRNVMKYFFVTFVPSAICLFYYSLTGKELTMYFPIEHPANLILANFPPEYFIMTAITAIFFGYCKIWRAGDKLGNGYSMFLGRMFVYFLLILSSSVMLILRFQSRVVPIEQAAHIVHFRYFLFLAPVSIFLFVFCVLYLNELFRPSTWMRVNLAIVVAGILIVLFVRTYFNLAIEGTYLFLHV